MRGSPRWRVRRQNKARGAYFILETGRNETRRTLSLGYVSAGDAERAVATLQAEENAGTSSRVFKLHAEQPDAAIAYLVGDPGVAVILPPPTPDYGRMTLREYQEKVYGKHRAKDKPRTWRTEEGHWKRILEGLGDVQLRDLEPRMFFRWVRDLKVIYRPGRRKGAAAEGEILVSGAYQRLFRAALQALLTHAYVEGHVDEHVRLGAIRIPGSTLSAQEKSDALDLDEVKALLEAAGSATRRCMWAVGIGQGLRPGELVRVEWSDVDWSDRVLRIRGTKTAESAAVVPMTPLAFTELRAFWIAKGQPKGGPCFTYGGNGLPREPKVPTRFVEFKKALKSDAEAAGITRKVYPYLLRHSFATIAWSLGIDQDVARRIMRHTTTRLLDTIYSRPRPAELAARVAAFDVG